MVMRKLVMVMRKLVMVMRKLVMVMRKLVMVVRKLVMVMRKLVLVLVLVPLMVALPLMLQAAATGMTAGPMTTMRTMLAANDSGVDAGKQHVWWKHHEALACWAGRRCLRSWRRSGASRRRRDT